MAHSKAALLAILMESAALASTALADAGRRLSYTRITGYEPGSDVTQHSRIDLDQEEMESHLSSTPPDFEAAMDIYLYGANSGAYAEITLDVALTDDVLESTLVQQSGTTALGYVKSAAAAGATTLKVTYTSTCKEGGSSSPDTSGCFDASGNIEVCTTTADVCPSYTSVGAPSAVENQYRTLAGFSTAAQSKMAGQEYYAVYRAYYNEGDYAHQMVIDALNGTGTCADCDSVARVEIAKKTSAYLNVWMYVIREMEDAIMDCQNGCIDCNDDPVHAWDEAVAFYSGSLEGTDGEASGKLLHQLADKRCDNFGTCAPAATDVNVRIIEEFALGQAKLLQGECVEAIPIKRRIVQLMTVPLVQGSLRYAYKVDRLQGASKEKAEGHAFSRAIVPRVAACDPAAAQVIADNLAYSASSTSFSAVKAAFESTYDCLGITCEDVGGLLLNDDYYDNAEPCVTSTSSASSATIVTEEKDSTILIIIIVVVGVLALTGAVASFFFFRRMTTAYKELEKSRSNAGATTIGQSAS